MIDGVRILGIRLAQLAGEDLRLLPQPGCLENVCRRMVAQPVGCARHSHALIERHLIRHVVERRKVRLGRLAFDEGRAHRRSHEIELVHRR